MSALRGTIAAALTPLTRGGDALELEVIPAYTTFLAEGGVDGLLVSGTTGEGVLLSVDERRRLAEAFLTARPDGFAVAVHAGCQTTADTVALAQHASASGADAVAVIAPPYFPLGEDELLAHLAAAARACEPLPFYVYEFAARSGYPIPVAVVERLRGVVGNVAGMKVSDSPWSAVQPYVLPGLDVFVGSEPLIPEALDGGATGSVSGLAAAFPELVSRLVRDRADDAHRGVLLLRERLASLPFHAALKLVLADRGVPIGPDVRAPLRGLTDAERDAVRAAARDVLPTAN